MIGFVGIRILRFLATVLAASAIAFFALHVFSDPVSTMLPIDASNMARDELRSELGLDRPFLVQYVDFLANALHGDLGMSLWLREPALGAVLARLPATAMIVLPATLLGVVGGMFVGLVSGRRPGTRIDDLTSLVSYVLVSMPEFWVAILGIYIFSVQLGWVVPAGYGTGISGLVLPVVVLAIRPFARSSQVMRASTIEECANLYTTTARSKGLTESQISYRHIWKNAALPTVVVAFYDLGRLFVGSAIAVEVVFAWPGIGRLAVSALLNGDVFLVQSIVLIGACVIALLVTIGDLIYYFLDPRTRRLVGVN